MDFFEKYKDLSETKDFDNALNEALEFKSEISTVLGSLQKIRDIKNRFPHFEGKYTHCHNIIHHIIEAKKALQVIQDKVRWIKKSSQPNLPV